MSVKYSIVSILFLLALLAGCGGGGVGEEIAIIEPPIEEPPVESTQFKALWNATAGGSQNCYTVEVAAWADCSSISIGAFDGQATFGRGEATETTLEASSVSDGFFARYDPDGALVWAKAIPGMEWTVIQDAATSTDGSFVLCGYLSGDTTLDPGGPNETEILVEGYEAGFLACFEGDGALRWAHRMDAGAGGVVETLAVTTRPDGSIVVGGLLLGALVLGQGQSEETTLQSSGVIDGYMACYGPFGNLLWARQTVGASAGDVGTVWALASFDDGSLAVAGDYEGQITLGFGEPAQQDVISTEGANDVYLARYDAEGRLIWAGSSEGLGDESVHALAITPDGDIRLAGSFTEEISYPSGFGQLTLISEGGGDGFVAAFSGDGDFQWASRIGGAGRDSIQGLAVQPNGHTVVAGYFQGSASFGLATEEQMQFETPGQDDLDGFFTKFSADGQLTRAVRVGGEGDDYLMAVHPTGPSSTLAAGTFTLDACIGGPDPLSPEIDGAEGATHMDGQGACDACLIHLERLQVP